jgi:hypothetical protein
MPTLAQYPTPRLPHGWTRESLSRDDAQTAAADREGLIHVNIDGAWMLYVPWFRGDHHAVLRHRDGSEVVAKINESNTITTPGGRKVGSRKWYH